MKTGVKGLQELSKFMNEKDWEMTFHPYAIPLIKIGEAIESEAKRKKKPIEKVAKSYHYFYFRKKLRKVV
jgi:hypothetical protein